MPTNTKSRTNVSIDRDILSAARDLRINISAVLEARLRDEIKIERQKAWKAENRGALDDANGFLERHGLWSDGLRQF